MDTIQKQENWLSDLQKILFSEGALKIGFGDLTDLPEEPRMGMPRGISIAVPLDLAVVNALGAGMTHAYHAEYNHSNALLSRLARLTADFLQNQGFNAIPIIGEAVKESYQEHGSVLPHKTVATRAGMGWIGKNALLITRERGSAVRITSVLTDAPLPCAVPVNESSCGDCVMCVRSCPGQAPLGPAWSVTSMREDFLDVLACRKTCVERSWRIAPGMSMCSLCVLVCPWTRKAIEEAGLSYGFPAVEMVQKGDLEEILALQKIAFVSEAILCGDFTIPPLVQTLEELKAEYSDPRKAKIFLKVIEDRRIVGSVRAFEADGTCYVSRLMVHPDYQRNGLGRRLMQAIETCYGGARFELFTGEKSVGDILFYQKIGYQIFKTQEIPGKAGLVYLEKS